LLFTSAIPGTATGNLDSASSGYDLGFHLDLDLLCLHFHYPAIHPTDLLDLGHADVI
jgi:hypothetical protein